MKFLFGAILRLSFIFVVVSLTAVVTGDDEEGRGGEV